jgi:small ligand-binding sensory domain FIST
MVAILIRSGMAERSEGEPSMGALMIKCRETGQDLYTGIDLDERTFAYVPDVSMQTACPYCGATHGGGRAKRIWRMNCQ